MLKRIAIFLILISIFNPISANLEGKKNIGIDKVYGEKVSWWKPRLTQFLSNFGIEKSYALVVGISNYNDNQFENLPTEKDAIRIKDYLINQAGFDHVHLLTEGKVTRERVHELMSAYQGVVSNNDRFLFYWSGHGVTESSNRKAGYLAVQNSTQNKATMISMINLRNWDNGLKARQTLYLLDACFSGIAASKPMNKNQERTIERISRPSRQVLTAGLENQRTIVVDDIGGGVFTRALLDGLNGHADTNKGMFEKDYIVTARELEEYVRERVDHERLRVGWKEPITPVLYNFSHYAGDFFFVTDKSKLKDVEFVTPRGNNASNKITSTGSEILPIDSIKSDRKPPAPAIQPNVENHKQSLSTINQTNSEYVDGFMGDIFGGNTFSAKSFTKPTSIKSNKKLIINSSESRIINGDVEHGLIVSGMAKVIINGNLLGKVIISGSGNVLVNGNSYGDVVISGMGELNINGSMTGKVILSGLGSFNAKGGHIGKLIK